MSLIGELKRRNVFRVALLYIVASWIIMQVADVGVSLLGLPVTTGRLVFLLLAIGFPLVMLFSWAYEITPDGLKKEKEVDRSASVTQETARKLNTAVIVLLVVAIGGLALDRFIPEPEPLQLESYSEAPAAGPAASENSIAVLPFVNMSADEENEYFSDGLSEELLNLLAKIPQLRVAARTSTFSFKGSNASIDEIAVKLNVAHVLEGSVRKSGDKIRITAQLIKASDGYHLWSHSWDRTLTDVFVIQDEIAAAVVEALRITLLGEMPKTNVTDTEAYSLYLRSKQAANQFSEENMQEAAALLTQALAIDPEYVEAWVQLSSVQTNLVGQGFVPQDEGYSRAIASAERALKLDPKNAQALSNLGWIEMYWKWNFEKAARMIREANRLEPGNASILNAYGVLTFAFGRRNNGISLYKEALALDPLAVSVLANLSGASYGVSDYEQMEETIRQLEEAAPDSVWVDVMTAWMNQGLGNAEAALEIFERPEIPAAMSAWGRAIAHYDLGQDAMSDAAIEELISDGDSAMRVAGIYAHREDSDKAFEWLERAYSERNVEMVELRMYHYFDGLRNDPRWDAIVEKIGMTDELADALGL